MVEQTNMLQRMRELAVQSANATNSTGQRAFLDKEYQELTSQISTIGTQTMWNSTKVLSAATLKFQVGINDGESFAVVIKSTSNTALQIDGTAIASAGGAGLAMTAVDSALNIINDQRAQLGATMNRLTYTADNLSNVSANLSASRSTIMDTDYATASSQLSKTQIIQQAATAMLAQANQQPQAVLSLLK